MLKKAIFSVFLVAIFALSVVLFNGTADAVTGVCSNCHTMHNSQNGEAMAWDETLSPTSTPNELLLRASCVACHTTDSGMANSSSGAPAVYHTTTPSGIGGGHTNAGGSFAWVVNTSADTKGHNVKDLGLSADSNFSGSTTPPGWDPDATLSIASTFGRVASGASDWGTNQLTCAGVYGCHGNHTGDSYAGIKGAHHSNTGGSAHQASTADTVGNSFRFLGGIMGLENSQWNFYETTSNHNEYYGQNLLSGRTYSTGGQYNNTHTISFLCAECHGQFHSEVASSDPAGSPWKRHPTDFALPSDSSKEYANYNNGGGYNLEAPVARASVPSSSSSSFTAGSDIVMCLSCHRAHGSPYDDLLRWDYSSMVAGGGSSNSGCFVCHTTKDTGA